MGKWLIVYQFFWSFRIQCFQKGSKLDMSFAVRPYIPPPIRCYRCQRYGHIAAVCKGKQRCPKCGGDHRIENCEKNAQDKCCNCGGQHRVTYSGCNVRKRAVEIEQVKMVNNISYAEAVKKVQ